MSTTITNITHYDEFTEEPGGGTSYLNGNVGGKHISTVEGYFYRAATDKYLRFLNGDIENINELDGDSWIDLGFVVGATISVSGSVSNDGTYVLTGVTDTILSTAETFIDEDTDLVDIYDDTPVTCVDFYYNIIENSEAENYYSRTDAGAIQRFNNTSYDATGEVGVAQNMFVSSDSFGWVTNTLDDDATGETSQVRVTNVETIAHKQYFLINHIFFITPFCLNDQVSNFENEVPPDYLNSGRSLKYIAKVNGNTSCGCGDANHTGSATTPSGCVAWFDQNNKRTRADYYCESITYVDQAANTLDALDINKVVTVTITLKSRTGQFQFDPLDTRIIAAFTYMPLNTDRYVFTPDTLLRENFVNDRCDVLANAGTTNGEFYGTDYQVLVGVGATCASTTTLTVTFNVDFSTALKTFFEGLEQDNRKYFITVMTQDIDITTTNQNDRVNVLCDFNEIEWDKDIDDLIAPFDDLHVNQFPETDATQDSNNVSGFEGDNVVAKFPFKLLLDDTLEPTLLSAKIEIVAVKTDRDDFLLEGKSFDTSLVRKFEGVQSVDMSETRNYQDMIDYYKDITLVRDSEYDTTGATDYAGFIFNYPFVLRYEYWAEIIQQADEYQYDIFEDIAAPTQSWDTLQSAGWALKVKFTGVATAYDGHEQTYTQYWGINVDALGATAAGGPALTCTQIFEDTEEDVVVEGIVEGGLTTVTTIWEGDFSVAPADTVFAYIFADYDGGGVYNRRFASSVFDSDTGCPFSAPDYDLTGYTLLYQTDNAKLYVDGTDAVIFQTIYDDSISNWTKTFPEILMQPRIGFYEDADDTLIYYI